MLMPPLPLDLFSPGLNRLRKLHWHPLLLKPKTWESSSLVSFLHPVLSSVSGGISSCHQEVAAFPSAFTLWSSCQPPPSLACTLQWSFYLVSLISPASFQGIGEVLQSDHLGVCIRSSTFWASHLICACCICHLRNWDNNDTHITRFHED